MPSLAALIFLYEEFINALIRLIGILINSSNNTLLNWLQAMGTGDIPVPPYSFVQCVAHILSHCMLAGRVRFVMVRQKANSNSGYVGPGIIIGVKLTDVAAQEELQQSGGHHPCTSLLLNYRTAPKSIPLNKASVGEVFPTT